MAEAIDFFSLKDATCLDANAPLQIRCIWIDARFAFCVLDFSIPLLRKDRMVRAAAIFLLYNVWVMAPRTNFCKRITDCISRAYRVLSTLALQVFWITIAPFDFRMASDLRASSIKSGIFFIRRNPRVTRWMSSTLRWRLFANLIDRRALLNVCKRFFAFFWRSYRFVQRYVLHVRCIATLSNWALRNSLRWM